MARIVLGKRPETISLPVAVTLLDGSKTTVKVTYRYRTRSEYTEFIKEFGERQPASQGARDPGASIVDWFASLDEGRADLIQEIATGWDLAEDFTNENIRALIDEYPAVAEAIIDSYRMACVEGRRGN